MSRENLGAPFKPSFGLSGMEESVIPTEAKRSGGACIFCESEILGAPHLDFEMWD